MNKPVKYIAFVFCLTTYCGFGQENLILNGDFEQFSECPAGFSDPSQSPKEIEKCIGWNAPTHGTSDFYHECAVATNVSIPLNPFGEQATFSGDGYLGAYFTNYTGGTGTDGYNGPMWWEYIQGELITPLEENKVYKLSMKISLAEYSDLVIKEFGAYFSKTSISTANTASLDLTPQCIFTKEDYFGDTLNWMHVESYFVATGDEKYIVIGNFKSNLDTDTLRRYNYEPLIENPKKTYYYIDDVVLSAAEFDVPNVFTPNGDGINDAWSPNFNLPHSSIHIINRWGNTICSKSSDGFSWDGVDDQGKPCMEGTYFYFIEDTKLSGFIQLVR